MAVWQDSAVRNFEKRKEQYIGQVINGWKIIDVYKNPSVKGNDLFCTALCTVCGRKSDMRLFQVKKFQSVRSVPITLSSSLTRFIVKRMWTDRALYL